MPPIGGSVSDGAPQVIGRGSFGQRRAARPVARPAATLDQTVAVEHDMDGALSWNPDIAVEPPDQKLPDLAGTPMRLLALEPDDQALDRRRQLVGIAHRPLELHAPAIRHGPHREERHLRQPAGLGPRTERTGHFDAGGRSRQPEPDVGVGGWLCRNRGVDVTACTPRDCRSIYHANGADRAGEPRPARTKWCRRQGLTVF
jgi:hypothetical protein